MPLDGAPRRWLGPVLTLAAALTAPTAPAAARIGIERVQVFNYLHRSPSGERGYLFAKITATNGAVGWGEGRTLGQTEADALARRILALGSAIERAPVEEIDRLLDLLWYGSGYTLDGLQAAAVSALDGALHDLNGKLQGRPVYELLGGAVRDRIPVYHANVEGNPAEVHSVERLVELARGAVAQGFGAIKWDPFILAYVVGNELTPAERSEAVARTRLPPEDVPLDQIAEQFRRVREAVGPEVQLVVEAHGRLSPEAALAVGERLAPIGIAFFDSPVNHFDVEGTARVSRRLRFPVAQGDVLFRVEGFRGLIMTGASGILRPEVAHCGGIREALRIAALAAEHGLQIAPFRTGGPVSAAMALHVAAVIPNLLMLDYLPERDRALEAELLYQPIFDFAEGTLGLIPGPGLGVQLRQDALTEIGGE